jgi:hypothetical protein
VAIDRATLALTIRQRCFWLVAMLLLLFVSLPFLEATPAGSIILNAATLLVLIVGAAAVGRSAGAVLISVLLAVPTALCLFLAVFYEQAQLQLLSLLFGAAFFLEVTIYLLSYTFRRDVLTMDKLYGAAAAFLLLGILWTYLYWILLAFYPGALTINGQPLTDAPPSTMLYFSYVTLTSTGMSDIMPLHPVARILCAMEMITGVLFIADLLAASPNTTPRAVTCSPVT